MSNFNSQQSDNYFGEFLNPSNLMDENLDDMLRVVALGPGISSSQALSPFRNENSDYSPVAIHTRRATAARLACSLPGNNVVSSSLVVATYHPPVVEVITSSSTSCLTTNTITNCRVLLSPIHLPISCSGAPVVTSTTWSPCNKGYQVSPSAEASFDTPLDLSPVRNRSSDPSALSFEPLVVPSADVNLIPPCSNSSVLDFDAIPSIPLSQLHLDDLAINKCSLEFSDSPAYFENPSYVASPSPPARISDPDFSPIDHVSNGSNDSDFLPSKRIAPRRKKKKSPAVNHLNQDTPLLPVQQDVEFPGSHCRIGDSLHFLFPLKDYLSCTEPGCSSLFVQANWSASFHALARHLDQVHNILKPDVVRWCSFCKIRLPFKISSHSCFAARPYFDVDLNLRSFKHKCSKCNYSCPSKGGMRNHERWHVAHPKASSSPWNTRKSNVPPSSPHEVVIPDNVTSRSDDCAILSPPPSRRVLIEGSNSNPFLDDASASVDHLNNDFPDFVLPDSDFYHNDDSVPVISDNHSPEHDLPVNVLVSDVSAPAVSVPTDPDAPSPSADFTVRFFDILSGSPVPDWDLFILTLDEYISFAQRHVKLPPEKPFVNSSRAGNARNPQHIQKLFRRNRRRAVRDITGNPSVSCSIAPAEMASHFFDAPSASCDSSIYSLMVKASSPLDLSSLSAEEIWSRLSRAENTSPGIDRLTFHHWKSVDPDAKTLALIFNICIKCEQIPLDWKTSKTVFIPKKSNSSSSPSDWRPISLCSTISKLFTGCLARRLSDWAIEHNILSPAQKGFMPYDGAFENIYLLSQKFQSTRASASDELCIASIDLSNAFGSAPHEAILASLSSSGVGQPFVNIICDLLSSLSTTVFTSSGVSDSVSIACGVRQGDPISGILFNFAIDPVIRSIQAMDSDLAILAFADDLLILANSPAKLEDRLDLLGVACNNIGFIVNPKKCFSLHLAASPRRCEPTSFSIGSAPIPYLLDGDAKSFLGKPFGFQVVNNQSNIDEFISSGKKLLSSFLAPWQRVDAMKSFFYPSLSFAQRTHQFQKVDWNRLDKELRPLFKNTLSLPKEAANEYLFGHQDDCLFGIPLAAEDSDVALIDSAFKLLTSSDPYTSNTAWADLLLTVKHRLGHSPSNAELAGFLSNESLRRSNQNSNIWTQARLASGRLHVIWDILDDNSISISLGDTTITDRRKIFKSLRSAFKSARSSDLKLKRHQGKTAHCFSKAKCSGHFHRSGDFFSFADWRFIHRARLGLLPLNGRPGNLNPNQGCRRCKHSFESIPHVLCHCPKNLKLITCRHNDIVNRIKKAASGRWNILTENQPIAGSSLRPDLVLTSGDSALVLDVAVTFENGPDAFSKIRAHKSAKYLKITSELRNRFKDVRFGAIVVGALGSWDPSNDKIILRLCSKKYLSLMKKLIVSDTIRASREMYTTHITGLPVLRSQHQLPKKNFLPAPLENDASRVSGSPPTSVSLRTVSCDNSPQNPFVDNSTPICPSSSNPFSTDLHRSVPVFSPNNPFASSLSTNEIAFTSNSGAATSRLRTVAEVELATAGVSSNKNCFLPKGATYVAPFPNSPLL